MKIKINRVVGANPLVVEKTAQPTRREFIQRGAQFAALIGIVGISACDKNQAPVVVITFAPDTSEINLKPVSIIKTNFTPEALKAEIRRVLNLDSIKYLGLAQ